MSYSAAAQQGPDDQGNAGGDQWSGPRVSDKELFDVLLARWYKDGSHNYAIKHTFSDDPQSGGLSTFVQKHPNTGGEYWNAAGECIRRFSNALYTQGLGGEFNTWNGGKTSSCQGSENNLSANNFETRRKDPGVYAKSGIHQGPYSSNSCADDRINCLSGQAGGEVCGTAKPISAERISIDGIMGCCIGSGNGPMSISGAGNCSLTSNRAVSVNAGGGASFKGDKGVSIASGKTGQYVCIYCEVPGTITLASTKGSHFVQSKGETRIQNGEVRINCGGEASIVPCEATSQDQPGIQPGQGPSPGSPGTQSGAGAFSGAGGVGTGSLNTLATVSPSSVGTSVAEGVTSPTAQSFR